jgi:xylan 1,4-beta-xylosidase
MRFPERSLAMKYALAFVALSTFILPAAAQNRPLTVDAASVTGQIRPLEGVNGGPAPVLEGLPSLEKQYRKTLIDIVRTHDYMGPTEIDSQFDFDNQTLAWLVPDPEQRRKLVAAGNAATIFPDWSADPENPASYRFGPTDAAIASILASGAEVYYRIGRSFGARINPPPDFDKFADVVKHVEMHYNQGWDNGFHDHIRYWEFWNEPELFWSGTPEQFYSLYEKTAKALKSADPSIKVGGDTIAFSYPEGPFREGFLDYVRAHKLPLDFYSWHCYTDFSADPLDAFLISKEIRHVLNARGFQNVPTVLSEFNRSADFTSVMAGELRSVDNAAFVADTLIYLEDSDVARAMFYRGDAAWMGLFDLDGKPYKPAFSIRAMGELQKTPVRLSLSGADQNGFAAIAGRSRDGKIVQVLISNYEIPANYQPHIMTPPPDFTKDLHLPDFSKIKRLPARKIDYKDNAGYDLSLKNLPWGEAAFTMRRYRLDSAHDLSLVEESEGLGASFKISRPLPPPGLELIVLTRK